MKTTLFFLVITLIASCSASKNKGPKQDVQKLNNLVVFPAIAIISTIERKSNLNFNNSLSEISRIQIDEQLKGLLPTTINKKVLALDTASFRTLTRESLKMLDSARSGESIEYLHAPEKMLNILDSLNYDFGIVAVQIGFTRNERNNANQQFKNDLINFFSPYWINVRAIPYSSYMELFIVNRKTKIISFYGKRMMADKEPTDEYVIKIQLRDLVNSYFLNIN